MSHSSTPILDNIQHAAAVAAEHQINNNEEIEEGKVMELKIKVNGIVYDFVIQKEPGCSKMTGKFLGDFRVMIQQRNDLMTLDLIEQLIYTPLQQDVIKYRCRDTNNNLLVHVLCWRGFVKSAHHFTDKFHSTICIIYYNIATKFCSLKYTI